MTATPSPSKTLDTDEVSQFAKLAEDWWDEAGPFRPLHKIGPARLTYLRDRLCAHFAEDPVSEDPVSEDPGSLAADRPQDQDAGLARDPKVPPCLEGLRVLDIGCGGGLVAEPLTRLGASVTGIDPGAETIAAAKAHAQGAGLKIAYEATTAEALVDQGRTFDAVLLLEVVEHVPDVPAFLKRLSPLVRPGGIMLLSTLNRTLKAYALAIVGAEYVLRWVPAGTHQWERFVRPEELNAALRGGGFKPAGTTGMVYDPLADRWSLSDDCDVNYFAAALKPAA